LGGRAINHDKMRTCVKTMYMPESTYHRKVFLPQRDKGKWGLKPTSKIGPIPIGNLGDIWERMYTP
jgi:hypothetical protein